MEATNKTVRRLSNRSKLGLYPREEVLEMSKNDSIYILQMQANEWGFFIVEYREINKEDK